MGFFKLHTTHSWNISELFLIPTAFQSRDPSQLHVPKGTFTEQLHFLTYLHILEVIRASLACCWEKAPQSPKWGVHSGSLSPLWVALLAYRQERELEIGSTGLPFPPGICKQSNRGKDSP